MYRPALVAGAILALVASVALAGRMGHLGGCAPLHASHTDPVDEAVESIIVGSGFSCSGGATVIIAGSIECPCYKISDGTMYWLPPGLGGTTQTMKVRFSDGTIMDCGTVTFNNVI